MAPESDPARSRALRSNGRHCTPVVCCTKIPKAFAFVLRIIARLVPPLTPSSSVDTLKKMYILENPIILLRNLSAVQEALVKTNVGNTDSAGYTCGLIGLAF